MFEIARMDFTQYRKHFFPKQQDGWDILSCCFESPLRRSAARRGCSLTTIAGPAARRW